MRYDERAILRKAYLEWRVQVRDVRISPSRKEPLVDFCPFLSFRFRLWHYLAYTALVPWNSRITCGGRSERGTMAAWNPTESPSPAKRNFKRFLGTAILCLGAVATVYGLFAFFVVQWLPPNNATEGRLPSLYVTFGELGTMLGGLVVRDLRLR